MYVIYLTRLNVRKPMDKYLFLYLMTGGGHYSPAKAIAKSIRDKCGTNAEIVLHDGLNGARPYVRTIIEDGYKTSVTRALWSFEILYALNKIKSVSRFTIDLVSQMVKQGIKEVILKERPYKIVIFHYFLIKPVLEVLQENSLKVSVLIVVTDPYTAPLGWFHYENQNFIVFSDKLKEKCKRMGIESKNIQVFPFVLDQKFSGPSGVRSEFQIRKDLGFREDSRIVLILGGGDGMPRGKRIFRNLVSSGIEAEIAVICGRDQKLFDHLTKLVELYKLQNVRIFGYIDFVDTLIQISDVVITKAGPSVCMEILLAGKVPIINNYIWEQEKGNMEFVCRGGMGIYQRNTAHLPEVVKSLFNDSEYYNSLTNNIKNRGIENGVGKVSEYILNFN